MSILVDGTTKVVIQGITGTQGRVEALTCRRYGTNVVAGVTPGRGGEDIDGIPVYDTVAEAVEYHQAEASLLFVPPLLTKDAVLEALDAGVRTMVATAEGVPEHDVLRAVSAARKAGARLVGFNTNGIISPGKARLGGLGGLDPAEIYQPGRIGVCSRSGGMCAEISLALIAGGYGCSTVVAMGGDRLTGLPMVEYVKLFEDDPETDAIVLFGEPGTDNESGVAEHLRRNGVKKPVIVLIVGFFQEAYPEGVSFGHAAAMIGRPDESPSGKRTMLGNAGARVVATLEEIPSMLNAVL